MNYPWLEGRAFDNDTDVDHYPNDLASVNKQPINFLRTGSEPRICFSQDLASRPLKRLCWLVVIMTAQNQFVWKSAQPLSRVSLLGSESQARGIGTSTSCTWRAVVSGLPPPGLPCPLRLGRNWPETAGFTESIVADFQALPGDVSYSLQIKPNLDQNLFYVKILSSF